MRFAMHTDVLSFVLSSGNRKSIVQTLFEYPKRQWSCSALEELNKMPHATVFRALSGLRHFGLLKSVKINKKDLIYELVSDSPLANQLKKAIDINSITSKEIACNFAELARSKEIYSILLYGSSVKGTVTTESDIDILVVLKKPDKSIETNILDKAAEYSSRINKTIAVVVMGEKEMIKEKNSNFMKSVIANMEVLYGKKPF